VVRIFFVIIPKATSLNKIYQRVCDLLLHLQKQLKHQQHPLGDFEAAVGELAMEFRRKRNFTALINKLFPHHF
jgi:hypothetical protein